jgi:16S rRNA processing protein RimM
LSDIPPESLQPVDIVVLGKIVGPYGLRGAVKIHPFADDPPLWGRLSHWWLGRDGEDPSLWRQTRLLRCKEHNASLIAELECSPDRDASEALKGVLVGVPRAALPKPDKDEYYWADLIGLDVINTHDQSLGRVLGLIETSANHVLRIGDGHNAERLLPFVAAVVLDVDMALKHVRVDWEVDW